MKKLAQITTISLLLAGLSSGHAQAVAYSENSDAGETLNTDQPVISSDSSPLKSITGTLNGDADLF